MRFTALLYLSLVAQTGADIRDRISWSPESAWPLVAGAWLLLLSCNVAVGWPQTKEARGSLSSLLWVSASLAIIALSPAIVMAAFTLRGAVLIEQCQVAGVSIVFSLFCVIPFLRPPVRLRGTKEKLPLVTDEQFLARVAALAEKMRVVMPLVRLWPSVSGSQQALAYAGTVHAPQLVVTDGILRRLEPAECDAIIAHELGHFANGSIWLLAAVIPISCAVMTAVTDLLPLSLALPFGIAFLVGWRRLFNRPAEFDCDLRAARAVGFRATISGLAKIHAVNPVPNSGFLSLLVFATATHPPRDARLAALYAAAPPDDRPAIAPNAKSIRKYRYAAAGALAIWVLVLSGTLVAAIWGRPDEWLRIPLWIVGLGPLGLLVLALQKQSSLARQRMGQRGIIRLLIVCAAVLGAILITVLTVILVLAEDAASANSGRKPVDFVSIVLAVVFCFLCLWLLFTRKKRKLLHEVAIALQVHDFRRALELCLAASKVVRGAHVLRYQQAIAHAVCGNRDVAITLLEQLWCDKPRFPLSALALGELLLDTDRAERAVEIAKSVAPRLRRDPAPSLLEARSLRRLGRIDDAQAACDGALAIDPDNGCVNALAAALALDCGETERAQALMKRALEFAPGDAYLLVVRAEIALQGDADEEARLAVSQAGETIRANPLVFLQAETKRLESALTERLQPVVTENIFIE